MITSRRSTVILPNVGDVEREMTGLLRESGQLTRGGKVKVARPGYLMSFALDRREQLDFGGEPMAKVPTVLGASRTALVLVTESAMAIGWQQINEILVINPLSLHVKASLSDAELFLMWRGAAVGDVVDVGAALNRYWRRWH